MESTSLSSSDKRLKKVLSRKELTYLSLGGIIGSGWLLAPLAAAAYAGVYSIFSWIIAGIMIMFIGLSYAEITSMIPKSGGIIRYPHYTHGNIVGFFMFWVYFISAISTVSIEAIATTTYLSHFFPWLSSSGSLSIQGIITAYILMIVFFFVNYFGVRGLGRISHGIGWWKLLIPTITTAIMFFFFNSTNFTFPIQNGISQMFYAIPASGIIFSYLGFRQAIEYGGEGKNPKKDVPFAIISSLLIAMALFTALEVAFIGALDWGKIGLTAGDWGGLLDSSISNSPILSIFTVHSSSITIALNVWISVLIFDTIVSPAGTGIIYTGTSARTLFGGGTNGYLPSIFSRVNERGIPLFSLIITMIGSALFLLPIPSWYGIVGISSSATVLTYVMGGIGLHSFRKHYPNVKRIYSLPAWKVIAPISTIIAGLLVYWSGFSTIFYIVVLGVLGLSAYLLQQSRMPLINLASIALILASAYWLYLKTSSLSEINNLAFTIFISVLLLSMVVQLLLTKNDRENVRASYWLIAFLIGISILSYLGSFGLYDLIGFPFDSLAIALFVLILHYVAVKTSIPNLSTEELKT